MAWKRSGQAAFRAVRSGGARHPRRGTGLRAAPSGLGFVVAFYTWGSRPRLYDVAPSGLALVVGLIVALGRGRNVWSCVGWP